MLQVRLVQHCIIRPTSMSVPRYGVLAEVFYSIIYMVSFSRLYDNGHLHR